MPLAISSSYSFCCSLAASTAASLPLPLTYAGGPWKIVVSRDVLGRLFVLQQAGPTAVTVSMNDATLSLAPGQRHLLGPVDELPAQITITAADGTTWTLTAVTSP